VYGSVFLILLRGSFAVVGAGKIVPLLA